MRTINERPSVTRPLQLLFVDKQAQPIISLYIFEKNNRNKTKASPLSEMKNTTTE